MNSLERTTLKHLSNPGGVHATVHISCSGELSKCLLPLSPLAAVYGGEVELSWKATGLLEKREPLYIVVSTADPIEPLWDLATTRAMSSTSPRRARLEKLASQASVSRRNGFLAVLTERVCRGRETDAADATLVCCPSARQSQRVH